jgi:glycosyltransferase Alg8
MENAASGDARQSPAIFGIQGLPGFALYTLGLFIAAWMLPKAAFIPGSGMFIVVLGSLAIWRYSWGFMHFCRSLIYRKIIFPELRRKADARCEELMPPHLYMLVTSFRIHADTTIRMFHSIVSEAIGCGIPVTIVASIVEMGDEFVMKDIFRMMNPPAHVKLQFVRIPGTGKRDGLAQGFRAISRDMPAPGSIVAVIDGDCIMGEGLVRKCAPFFRMMPNLGALTTDEECDVRGTRVMREWHHLRFAQRQVLMGSIALSNKVLTLTGRMSMFRSEIIVHPEFIAEMEYDSVNHWRLGHFQFLTGDDKSSWFWVLKSGYDMLYVPDTVVMTVEDPPSPRFLPASTALMFRWFGNMLRINGRALSLGPKRIGLFVWWCILDQRFSMWTSLTGPTFAILLTIKHSVVFLAIYLVWIGFTRWVMALMLLSARPVLSWYYPFLIYYNQIWGSCIKTFVFFRLDRQSWTRQKTKLNRGLSGAQARLLRLSSVGMHCFALLVFITLIGIMSGMMKMPTFF